ncbi:UvrD-helicase domain-containing protein [bacterium]|nr:UvrD-helicase domain-containing protein [bacterium]
MKQQPKIELNPQQREAVEHPEGPLLILAGAGSGKTRVLAARAAHLVHIGKARPWQILALTFTNKAAAELRERCMGMIGDQGEAIYAGTFHSIFAKLMRREGLNIDVDPHFTIIDADDSRRLIKTIMKEHLIPSGTITPVQISWIISKAKNSLISPEELKKNARGNEYQIAAKVYEIYERRLIRIKGMDFDDLLSRPLKAFKAFPYFLERLQNRFSHILVDEFQDTNRVQYKLVNEIARVHRNLCVVGDDDQSIYGFRGATIENILEFERDWHDAKIIRLEQNYRSCKPILDAAWSVIKNNSQRRPKKLWTEKEGGQKIDLIETSGDDDEALRIVSSIEDEHNRNKRPYSNIAVLYRTNAQSLAFERALRAAQIPYKVLGGLRFYERKEIKDVLAYLRLIVNPDDDVSFLRVVNYPPRGIGEAIITELLFRVSKEKGSFNQIVDELMEDADLSARRRSSLKGFVELINGFRDLAKNVDFQDLVREVITQTGLRERLQKEEKDDPSRAESKIANLDALIYDIGKYIDYDSEVTIESFLEEVSLVTEMDNTDLNEGGVNLLTLHSAKGLEFEVVCIVGLEEGLLPLEPRDRDRYESEIEEERRLFYVGATRAMERLILTYAVNRFRWGNYTGGSPSRFLSEIPGDLLNLGKKSSYRFHNTRQSVFLDTRTYRKIESKPIQPTISADGNRLLSSDELRRGLLVNHPKFGLGVVVDFLKRGAESKIHVDFDDVGMKILIHKYARLEVMK